MEVRVRLMTPRRLQAETAPPPLRLGGKPPSLAASPIEGEERFPRKFRFTRSKKACFAIFPAPHHCRRHGTCPRLPPLCGQAVARRRDRKSTRLNPIP